MLAAYALLPTDSIAQSSRLHEFRGDVSRRRFPADGMLRCGRSGRCNQARVTAARCRVRCSPEGCRTTCKRPDLCCKESSGRVPFMLIRSASADGRGRSGKAEQWSSVAGGTARRPPRLMRYCGGVDVPVAGVAAAGVVASTAAGAAAGSAAPVGAAAGGVVGAGAAGTSAGAAGGA